MEKIIEKLEKMDDTTKMNNWSLDEAQQLLQIYYLFTQKENHILDFIYRCHGADTYEDIFRDYDMQYLIDKQMGIKIALEELEECKNRIALNNRLIDTLIDDKLIDTLIDDDDILDDDNLDTSSV